MNYQEEPVYVTLNMTVLETVQVMEENNEIQDRIAIAGEDPRSQEDLINNDSIYL